MRKRRDLNSRKDFSFAWFRIKCLQPLSHASKYLYFFKTKNKYYILYLETVSCKLPLGNLHDTVGKVNIVKVNICCINNNFDDLEINDVLENIKLLLNYNRKKLINKGKSIPNIYNLTSSPWFKVLRKISHSSRP